MCFNNQFNGSRRLLRCASNIRDPCMCLLHDFALLVSLINVITIQKAKIVSHRVLLLWKYNTSNVLVHLEQAFFCLFTAKWSKLQNYEKTACHRIVSVYILVDITLSWNSTPKAFPKTKFRVLSPKIQLPNLGIFFESELLVKLEYIFCIDYY